PGKVQSRPCACGSTISAKDSHPLCIVCLGVRHAQTMLANPECCPHCALFPSRIRERRLRVAAANKGDPCLSPLPAERDEAASQAQRGWGEIMDEVSPVLPSLFESHSLLDNKGVEEEDDEVAHFLEEDLEDDEEDAILPPDLLSRPGSAAGPSPVPGELDLVEVCRRAAKKLSIEWPSQQVHSDAERDLYDGKRLPSRTSPVNQLIPAVPACVAEMRRFWDKPFSHRVPVKSFSRLEVHDMEALGISLRLARKHSLPSVLFSGERRCTYGCGCVSPPMAKRSALRISSSKFDRADSTQSQAAGCLHTMSVLQAYQADLLQDLDEGLSSGADDIKDLLRAADLTLWATRHTARAVGQTMAALVATERHLWLTLSDLLDKDRAVLLNALMNPPGLFGDAVTTFANRFQEFKKQSAAFQ
ncbi:hypothetical protein C0J45_1899, partial [Silurus meridionalis]